MAKAIRNILIAIFLILAIFSATYYYYNNDYNPITDSEVEVLKQYAEQIATNETYIEEVKKEGIDVDFNVLTSSIQINLHVDKRGYLKCYIPFLLKNETLENGILKKEYNIDFQNASYINHAYDIPFFLVLLLIIFTTFFFIVGIQSIYNIYIAFANKKKKDNNKSILD